MTTAITPTRSIDPLHEITLAVAPDETFDTARNHAAIMRTGAILFKGAAVALGAELIRLREEFQPVRGHLAEGDSLTWRERVEQQTGHSWETCRRAEKVAVDLLTRMNGKRDQSSRRVRDLLTRAGHAFTADDYGTLAGAVGEVYDADTWTGILQEIGIIRRPVKALTNSTGNKKISLIEEARLYALGFVRALQTPGNHRAQWLKRLGTLPLEPTGDSKNPSLTEIYAELEERTKEVKSVIDRKMN